MKIHSLPQLIFILFSVVCLSAGSGICASPEIPASNLRNVPDARIHLLEELHEKAEDHILKNDFQSAIRIYNDIILEEPDDETAYTGLGQCYLVLGDYDRAKNAYQNALHIDPDNQTAQAGLKKIKDPDSMVFYEDSAAKTPAIAPEAPLVTALKEDDIHLGAKKTMSPYSADIPQPIKNFNHEQIIQVALKNAGFYKGPLDGILGPATRDAVREFQKKYEIAVDGKVGPQTWELLQPYINKNGFEEKILKNDAAR